MIVSCGNCGKKYNVDERKIQGSQASGICTQCNEKIAFSLPQKLGAPYVESLLEGEAEREEIPHGFDAQTKVAGQQEYSSEPESSPELLKKEKGYFLAIRDKIFVLFFLFPLLSIVVSGYVYLFQLRSVSSLIDTEWSSVIASLTEKSVVQRAQDVANEVKLYLDIHPEIFIEQLGYDLEFREIALQKVGKTGYTAVNHLTESDKWFFVAGPEVVLENGVRKNLVNEELFPVLQKILSRKELKKIKGMFVRAEQTGKLVTGYHTFVDGKRFQAIFPVEGYPLFVHATTLVNEFAQPMAALQGKVNTITTRVQRIVLLSFAVTAVLIALIILFYATRISSKIKRLTAASNRISSGDMNVAVDSKDRDELGVLAESIANMQDSIKLSLSRLQRQRR